MLFTSKELAFAAGASSPNLFLNYLGRYNFRISAEKRIRGTNYYTAYNLGKAYLIGALDSQMIPTSQIPKLFDRIDWDAYALAINKMENHELDRLYVVFLAFEPEEKFSGVLIQPEDVEKAVLEYGHLTVVDLGHFILSKIAGHF
jgi:hypothetical protein